MNKIGIIAGFILLLLLISSCKKNDHHDDEDHDHTNSTALNYEIKVLSPSSGNKLVGDTIHIHAAFESATKQTVHHVKVRIFNKADSADIYNKPSNAHVHQTNGLFQFNDDFILSNTNGVMANSDWVLEAKVWGHDLGEQEVIKTIEFHVGP